MTEMKTLNIPKNASLSDIDALLKTLDASEPFKLRLPNKLKERGMLGIEAEIIQLIATWLRCRTDKRIFHTYVSSENSSSGFSDLCSHLAGIMALSFSDYIYTDNQISVTRKQALSSAKNSISMVRKEAFVSAFKGSYLAIPCITAPGYNREFEVPMYNSQLVVGIDKFQKIVAKAVEAVVPKNRARFLSEDTIRTIAQVLRELFTNTHKHARQNEKGDYYSENIRAILIKFSEVTPSLLEDWASDGGRAKAKFAGEWLKYDVSKPHSNSEPALDKSQKRLPFIEFSVIDSGPGFARRWKSCGKDMLSIKDEVSAVIDCFEKYNSTESGGSSGSGLTITLKLLRHLGGWFRLRTGNIAVEKGFYSRGEPHEVTSRDVVDCKSFSEGSAFTILLPLIEKKL